MLDRKERNFGKKTQKAQERAVAARMVTDLECNGVCRGAVKNNEFGSQFEQDGCLSTRVCENFSHTAP